MNVPDRVDAVMLPEGRKKYVLQQAFAGSDWCCIVLCNTSCGHCCEILRVEMSTVETVPNAASFRFLREDHTLGHMLRWYVMC